MNKMTFKRNIKKAHFSLIVSTALISPLYVNAENIKTHSSQSKSINETWQFTNLYKNIQGDYVKLSGRLQLDSTWVNSEQGNFDDTLWRRFRFGFKGKVSTFKLALEADINLNDSLSDAYNRLTDANVSWRLNKNTELKFLKQSTGFTLDGKTSSKKLLTPERNNLTNNLWFTSEYFTGVSVKGDLANNWSYKTGVFSSDGSDEISISDASYFTLLSTSRKLSKNNLWDKAEIAFDYVYNDTHEDGDTRDFSQVISMTSKFKQGNWGLDNDLSWGKGDLGQSTLFGLVIMPSYKQSESVQWIARYTYINSSDENGVRLGRYEKNIVGELGDQYQEFFGGINYYLNNHKLKLQAALQYAKMGDKAHDGGEYKGWGLTLALRSYW